MTEFVRPTIGHVALTVTDIDASVDWYQRVFGISFVMDVPHEGGVGKLLTDEAFSLVFVLHRHDGNDGATFAETSTGLDHVGLNLPNRAALDWWADHLESCGVVKAGGANKPLTQSPIVDEPYGAVLVFRDPDNIQLELFVPASG